MQSNLSGTKIKSSKLSQTREAPLSSPESKHKNKTGQEDTDLSRVTLSYHKKVTNPKISDGEKKLLTESSSENTSVQTGVQSFPTKPELGATTSDKICETEIDEDHA